MDGANDVYDANASMDTEKAANGLLPINSNAANAASVCC
jgi:hypothetical protein